VDLREARQAVGEEQGVDEQQDDSAPDADSFQPATDRFQHSNWLPFHPLGHSSEIDRIPSSDSDFPFENRDAIPSEAYIEIAR
jgi:hypothetical protein